MTLLYIVIAIFIILQVLDVISTNQALSRGNREANPIVKKLMDIFGPVWWLPKLVGVFALLYIGVPMLPVMGATVMIVALNIFYGYFVYNNFQLK